jgi:hypothetical protein
VLEQETRNARTKVAGCTRHRNLHCHYPHSLSDRIV